jgi:hypothetical protein
MTIIKNHFEVFLVTSKKQGNGIIESKVGLYSIKASSHTYICQLNVSRGQDSVFGIVSINSQRFVYLRDRIFVLFATANGYPAFKEF